MQQHAMPQHATRPACATRMVLMLGSALCFSTAALATTKAPTADAAKAQYDKERAACLSGQTNQDRATCLQEAGAALAAARKGDLTSEKKAELRRNARERCDQLPDDQRADCRARMAGAGKVEGSAEGGGIYRELVTTVPASAPAKP